jgi:hypothetical protein
MKYFNLFTDVGRYAHLTKLLVDFKPVMQIGYVRNREMV